MKVLKKVFDFYIQSSIHVALSVYSLVQMTCFMFHIPEDKPIANFAFFGTIVGYNFVKYDSFARTNKVQFRTSLKLIILFSALSFLATGFYFFQLQRLTQMVSIGVLSLTLLYTLPFFPNRKNARNWAGVKIYIVSLCWVGVTLVLPIIDSGIAITSDFYLKSIQRFILVFVLILIFEILDLTHDDPHLKTVPQQIGVKRTKNLGYFLLLIFCALELLNSNFNSNITHLLLVIIIAIITSLFLAFANEKRSKYYTSFWAESVPILWWFMVFLF
ncbi:hypothetical protein [Flavobacterium eburneipallidum]|uniref:hypothetical protein n=1 Tax=Flavobacterium eburneipallidum TaxID=3003263 RepID=UPI0022AC6FDE|nr:hypothetical protein [Flavobacterium eburneipallidum]